MKTNTEYLLNAFGYQGGTIHQLAEETGLTTSQILTLDSYQPKLAGKINCPVSRGWFSIKLCSVKERRENVFPKMNANIDFWYGVLCAMINPQEE